MVSTVTFVWLNLCLLLHQGFADSSSPTCSEPDTDVLILGGGISGVAAAKTLHDEGIRDFMIIDALPTLGGRIRTVELREGVTYNLGATWIQGYDPDQPNRHPIIKILNTPECGGITGFVSDTESLVVRNSQGMDISNSDRLRYDTYETASDAAEMLSISRKQAGLPDISVRDALTRNGWTPSTPEDNWVEWFEFDFCFGEPPDPVSLFQSFPLPTYMDFGNPNNTDDYFVNDTEGYAKVIRCLSDTFLAESDPRVHLNTIVNRIDWSDDCVCVSVDENGSPKKYCGRYGILTFSIGVLKSLDEAGLVIDPPLPQAKLNALDQLRMVHYIHIIAEFNVRFWEDNIEFVGHVNATNGRYFPLFLILNHYRNANIIGIVLTDTLADRFVRQDVESSKNELISVINNAYGLTLQTSNIINFRVPDWDTNRFFLGSYSNVLLGANSETFSELRAPLGGRLFISGEALNERYSGFAHGGYLSGIDTANDVIRKISSAEDLVASTVSLCISLILAKFLCE